MKSGHYDEKRLEARLLDRGFMNRFFIGRVAGRVRKSWHMYPLGLLFGLGFDTATEVGLLALAAGVATHHVSFLAVISLPLLFAAGMCLMDTIDGAFMSQAYGWAFANPIRRIYYNITVTSLSVAVALVIGSVELLQVMSSKLSLRGGAWEWLNSLDFGVIGYGIVGMFFLTWAVAVLIWKRRHIEERWGAMVEGPADVAAS
jgi:high-affinity nickel-transport protein